MILFYDIHLEDSISDFSFSKDESKHLSKVLRKKAGDQITITNGKGLEWNGELTHVASNSTRAKKIDSYQHSVPEKQIHLAIAPTKSSNRMEWLIEKLTELGIASITPLLCKHSERKVTKALRFEKIAIAALKQSQQFYLPEIHPLISFSDFLKNNNQNAYIAHCQKSPKLNLSDFPLNQNSITILIGPEGDFSQEEIDAAVNAGSHSVSLGNQRFRTETAGLLACHTAFLQQQIN